MTYASLAVPRSASLSLRTTRPDMAAAQQSFHGQAVLSMPASPAHVRIARRFVAAVLGHWRLAKQAQDDAVLIVSELAGNAARHGNSDLAIQLTRTPSGVRIDVADTGAPLDRADPEPDPEAHGRGLGIARALASRLSVWRSAKGWLVRADLTEPR